MAYTIRKVADSDKADILKFSQQHPWKPAYPSSLVNRFLNELSSTNRLIFDLHDNSGRVATGILIDKVNNPANDACLEVVGLREGSDQQSVIQQLVELCKQHCPSNRSGFQMGAAEDSVITDDFVRKMGLHYHYSTYEMENRAIVEKPAARADISLGTKDKAHEVYKLVSEAFKQSPDTSVPDPDTWSANFMKSNLSHYYLWWESNHLVGFANLVEPESGDSTEVRIIGVLSSQRGSGIGRDLLQHCLNQSLKLGYKKCHLTVAVENEKALGLYLRSGFEILEKHKCYRMDLKK